MYDRTARTPIMSNIALFFRLLADEEKDVRLAEALTGVAVQGQIASAYASDQTLFGSIPGSPLAYWADPEVIKSFLAHDSLEASGRTAKLGSGTLDDFRFVRARWEVRPERIL